MDLKSLAQPYAITASAMALLLTGIAVSADAPAPPAQSPAKQAVEARKAVYTLIAHNFRPVGAVLQGRAQYDAQEIRKRAARVAFLAELVHESFPEGSNVGLPGSKAKASIWSERQQFDSRIAQFVENSRTLARVTATEQAASDAFKSAASAVARDCKECHDQYREK